AEVRAALDKVNNHLTMHIYYALRDAYVELGKDMHWASETADEIWSDARAILFAEFYRRWREHPTPDRPQFPSHHGQ
ncbi:MAG: hypothetical protein HY335_07935, partial [Deinococcus sp.]|nr:hypothetical protein [Deinococcus sp.]